jgi:hypothetical protein
VTVVEDIKDNIIGIDFMHANKMNYDAASKQITFAHILTNALYSLKETTIPTLSTMIIQAKFKGNVCNSASLVATRHAQTNPIISGIARFGHARQIQKLQIGHRQLCSVRNHSCQK